MEDQMINIQNYLPHRAPMLMVDHIIEIASETAETSFTIKEDTLFVHDGYFVEAGLIENLAQTCSCIFGQSFFTNPNKNTKVIGFITSVKKIEIFGLPKIGQEIRTKAIMISKYDNICHVSCESFIGETFIIKADLNLFIQELKS